MASDPLHLRSLPDLEPPEALWTHIAEQLEPVPAAASTTSWRLPVPLAMAAGVVAVALFLSLLRPGLTPEGVVPAGDPLQRLQVVSAALERQLESYRGGVIDAATADSLARMERELAWLDMRIGEQPDSPVLWAERVALLGGMVERHMATDWRADLMLASY